MFRIHSNFLTFLLPAVLACSISNAQEITLNSTQKIPTSIPTRVPNAQLLPILKLADDVHEQIDAEVDDYSCLVIRQERVRGRLRKHEFMVAKVRNQKKDKNGKVTVPFGVYLKFLKPSSVKGREVLFVEGKKIVGKCMYKEILGGFKKIGRMDGINKKSGCKK